MIKYQVQAREILTKDEEIEDLRAQLVASQSKVQEQERTIAEQRNKIDQLEGSLQRLQVMMSYLKLYRV